MQPSFDNIKGYVSIKAEMEKVLDELKNPEKYKKIGATPLSAIMLSGHVGTGKTLIATTLAKKSERPCYFISKSLSKNNFIDFLNNVFEKAEETKPSIIILDDIDRFANEDSNHKNAEEYIAIQSLLDKKSDSVFVIATANESWRLPDSLMRNGRLGFKIEIDVPNDKESLEIGDYYLSKLNNLDPDVDREDFLRILNGCSCADIESVVANGAREAAFENSPTIHMKHLLHAVIRFLEDDALIVDHSENSSLQKYALHEAGHAVCAEILEPYSVTCVAAGNSTGKIKGVTGLYIKSTYQDSFDQMKNRVTMRLGGKAATEVVTANIDIGCRYDISRAAHTIDRFINEYDLLGFRGCVHPDISNESKKDNEDKIVLELNNYYARAKSILIKNRDFLDKLTQAITEKQILTTKDIQKIKATCTIVNE